MNRWDNVREMQDELKRQLIERKVGKEWPEDLKEMQRTITNELAVAVEDDLLSHLWAIVKRYDPVLKFDIGLPVWVCIEQIIAHLEYEEFNVKVE